MLLCPGPLTPLEDGSPPALFISRLYLSRALFGRPRRHGYANGIRKPHAGDDHWSRCYAQGANMSKISRRKFVTAGLAATAGVSGVAVAANFAKRYGLVPPDSGGIYGPGETLTYAAQRLLTRHSLAREFPRSMISKVPFANAIPPLNDAFKRFQDSAFADWRFSIDGMVTQPALLSLSDLQR